MKRNIPFCLMNILLVNKNRLCIENTREIQKNAFHFINFSTLIFIFIAYVEKTNRLQLM